MSIVICLVSAPSQEVGAQLAKSIVDKRLAACVNIIPALQSVYRWKGEVTLDEEVLLLIKTTPEQVKALESAVVAEHPYEVPEFVVLGSQSVSALYSKWVFENTGAESDVNS
jgi:periplasmic divalent cation tolerance protein